MDVYPSRDNVRRRMSRRSPRTPLYPPPRSPRRGTCRRYERAFSFFFSRRRKKSLPRREKDKRPARHARGGGGDSARRRKPDGRAARAITGRRTVTDRVGTIKKRDSRKEEHRSRRTGCRNTLSVRGSYPIMLVWLPDSSKARLSRPVPGNDSREECRTSTPAQPPPFRVDRHSCKVQRSLMKSFKRVGNFPTLE